MILVIQNGKHNPGIIKYLKNYNFTIVKSFERKLDEINLDLYNLVIILGGFQSVTKLDEYPELLDIIKLISRCEKLSKPVLGICLGFQLIALHLGLNIQYVGHHVGYDTNILNFDRIFRYHCDAVIDKLPIDKNLEYKTFEKMIYFIHYNNFCGIQCHPDIPPEDIEKYDVTDEIKYYALQNADKINEMNQKIINYLISIII